MNHKPRSLTLNMEDDPALPVLPPVAMFRVPQNPMCVDPQKRAFYKSLLKEANTAYDMKHTQRGEELETAARELETWVPKLETRVPKPRPPTVFVDVNDSAGAWWMPETPSQSETPFSQSETPQQSTTPRKAFSDTTPPPLSVDPMLVEGVSRMDDDDAPMPRSRSRPRTSYRRSRSRSRPRTSYRRSRSRSPYRRSRSRSRSPGTHWYPAPLRFDDRSGRYQTRTFVLPVSVAEECRGGGRRWHMPVEQIVNDLETVGDVVNRVLRRLRIANIGSVRVTRPHDVSFSDTVARVAARCEQQREPALCVSVW